VRGSASSDGEQGAGYAFKQSREAMQGAMNRKLVWIEQPHFRGFGCSECAWVFNPSAAPDGKSFDEMMRNFELQRDKVFRSHVCADHPGAKGTISKTSG
jgi:hypothetical protein